MRLLVQLVAFLALASLASADTHPRMASDGIYIGTRLAPGSAFLAGWDLDVYLLKNRAVSLGPAASIALLGADRNDGMEQDALVTVDLRLKIGLNHPGDAWRPYLIVGGGVYWARFPDDENVVEWRGEPLRIAVPAADGFGGVFSLGVGGDVFVSRHWGVTASFVTHVRLSHFRDRMPALWAALSVGIRFGI